MNATLDSFSTSYAKSDESFYNVDKQVLRFQTLRIVLPIEGVVGFFFIMEKDQLIEMTSMNHTPKHKLILRLSFASVG